MRELRSVRTFAKSQIVILWLIVILLLIAIVAYILWAPIVLFIDTATNQYYMRYGVVAKASAEADPDELIRLRLQVFFLNFHWFPLRWNIRKSKSEPKAVPSKKRKRRRMSYETMLRLLKSFEVKRFHLELDTGDYVLNAKLIPVSSLLSFTGADVAINFQDRNRLVLVIQNRAVNILKSFINLKI